MSIARDKTLNWLGAIGWLGSPKSEVLHLNSEKGDLPVQRKSGLIDRLGIRNG